MNKPKWLLSPAKLKISAQVKSSSKTLKKIRTRRDIEADYLRNQKKWTNGENYEKAVSQLSNRNKKMINSIFKLQQGYTSSKTAKASKKLKVVNEHPHTKLLKKTESTGNKQAKSKKKEAKRCTARKMCNGKICSALIKNNGNFCKRHRSKK